LNYQYAGRFLAGVGVGIESSVCPTYVAELAPAHMRGNITGLFQVCVVIGVALSYWTNYFTSISSSLKGTTAVWQIPVAMQLVPLAVMFAILPFIKESPRWLASKNRNAEALKNLAWVRNMPADDSRVQAEFSEIVAAVEEEKAATAGASWISEFRVKGNPKRFIIAMLMFVSQQWSGQNSINYYAPDIFKSIGITGSSASLLASGVYGLVKIVATALFMIFGVERAGRKKYFFFGALGMGFFLMMIGAIFKSHPPKVPKAGEELPVPPSGIGMAGKSGVPLSCERRSFSLSPHLPVRHPLLLLLGRSRLGLHLRIIQHPNPSLRYRFRQCFPVAQQLCPYSSDPSHGRGHAQGWFLLLLLRDEHGQW
jgi:hypothetical protein